jgi:hypothetical protein
VKTSNLHLHKELDERTDGEYGTCPCFLTNKALYSFIKIKYSTYLRTSGCNPFNDMVTASKPGEMIIFFTPSMSANFCFNSSVSVCDLAPSGIK